MPKIIIIAILASAFYFIVSPGSGTSPRAAFLYISYCFLYDSS